MGQAKWIWKRSENQANTWMCFVKDFSCDARPDRAVARIAVDSKYWLYINGRTVLFEGGLKRGQSPDSVYCDELDLHKYIVPGSNRIAILVWYFGKNGFSHVSSGRGGLYFAADVDGQEIVSDSSWRVHKNEAYICAPEGDTGPNFRLSESDIRYDASLELGEWYANAYDLSSWDPADEWDADEQRAFGKLVKREIPQFRFSGLKDFLNADRVKGRHLEEDAVVEMHLPANVQFTPYLLLDAPAGKVVTVRTENYYTNAPGEYGIKSVYITRDSTQAYESLGWLNGERALFEVPSGVTVLDLRYRETEYAADPAGSFLCDDAFLNQLWEKCYRTLHICMRDSFMDCPNRERAQWWGDVNIQMQMLLYCMDERAAKLYEKGVWEMTEWYGATGNMLTVVPSGLTHFELPFQNLAGIAGFYTYYLHTGNMELVRKVYPMSKQYVLLYQTAEDGLVVHREGSWDWPDWGEHADSAVMENAWYCLALDACAGMAEVLGLAEDAAGFKEKADRVRRAMRKTVTPDSAFYIRTDSGLPDDRGNALAVLARFNEGMDSAAILKVLTETENASPYMEKYVLDALCEMGRVDLAVARMKKRYGPMVEDSYSTLWELWNKESSLNHGWSGGPLITMSKYIAGISVAEPGGRRYTVAPHPCHLSHIRCTVPTHFGPLSVEIDRNADESRILVVHPREISLAVDPPDGKEHEKWNITFRTM